MRICQSLITLACVSARVFSGVAKTRAAVRGFVAGETEPIESKIHLMV
jgi:hypothetical protein